MHIYLWELKKTNDNISYNKYPMNIPNEYTGIYIKNYHRKPFRIPAAYGCVTSMPERDHKGMLYVSLITKEYPSFVYVRRRFTALVLLLSGIRFQIRHQL